MKPVTSVPTLDLAQMDAAIFNLDEFILTSDGNQDDASLEHRQRTLSSAMALAKELQVCQIKTAIVTAGPNGSELLNSLGLSKVFANLVAGAPEPYLKAAQLLKTPPERATIFASTQTGLQAAREGNFGVIVFFNQLTSPSALKTNGTEVIVVDLCELPIRTENGLLKRNTIGLPSGLVHFQDISRNFHDKSAVVFLDYDGTLTPIVDRPDLAILSEHTRETLRQLAKHCTVGVISGRDRQNVQQLVNVDSLIYAGSHGFDISGPKFLNMHHQMGAPFLPVLDQVEASLHEQLDSIVGILIERKKYSVAVHYRLVGSQDLEAVRTTIEAVVSQHPDIRTIHGKKLYDLQPRIDWDKGKALFWLMQALNISPEQAIPFFLGDDLTDEDAFRTLQDGGIGIIVEDTARFTYATYRLNNPQEVDQFLRNLTNFLRNPVP